MNIIDNPDSDLGFELEDDTNFFELYAQQNPDTEDAADVDISDKVKDKPKPAAAPTTTKATTTETSDTTDEQGPEVDGDLVSKMIADSLKAGKGKTSASSDTSSSNDDDTSEDDNDTDGDENPISIVYTDFKEKGIISVPDDFEFDGTEEGLEKAIKLTVQQQLDSAVDEEINAAFTKNPENAVVAKELIRHLAKGGNVASFVDNRKDYGIKVDSLDSEDETERVATAKNIITAYHRDVLGWSDDKIQRKVERTLANEDLAIEEARDLYDDYKATMQARRDADTNRVASENQRIQNETKAFTEKVTSTIETAKEIAGFELNSKKERDELRDYMYKPTVEVNGKLVPQFEADRQSVQKDADKLLAQALFLKNGLKPNVEKVEKAVTSKLSQKLSGLQKNIQSSGKGTNSSKSVKAIEVDLDNLEVINL